MAAYPDRTATLIVTEGLKQGGKKNPTSNQITRATDEWLRNALRKLEAKRLWKPLENTKTAILTAYNSIIGVPLDFLAHKRLRIFYGDHEGSCQAVTDSTITLEAGEDVTEQDALNPIFLKSGTLKGEMTYITSYNTSTLVAGVAPNFSATPSGGDGYMIANQEIELSNPITGAKQDVVPIRVPNEYQLYGEPLQIHLNAKVDVDRTYAFELEYFVDLNKIDLSDARLTSVYNKYEDILIQEICVATLRDIPNTKRLAVEIPILNSLYKNEMSNDIIKNIRKGMTAFRYRGGMPRGR